MQRQLLQNVPLKVLLSTQSSHGILVRPNIFFLLILRRPKKQLHKATKKQGRKEMFYLNTHSTHFIYGYMASDIWLRTILIVKKQTRCRHIRYSFRLTARVLLYASSHRQDSTYHGLCYTSRGALAGTRNSQETKTKNFNGVLGF